MQAVASPFSRIGYQGMHIIGLCHEISAGTNPALPGIFGDSPQRFTLHSLLLAQVSVAA